MRLHVAASVAGLVVAQHALAQRGPALKLASASATHAEEFTSIVGVRELSDGRVLVSDGRETRVALLDFATGSVELVGRPGNGPGEYRRAMRLYALRGDSTIMPQDNGGSWVLFAGAKAVATLSPEKSLGTAHLAMPCGFDLAGNALILNRTAGEQKNIQGLDSLDLILLDRATLAERRAGLARSPYGALPGTPGGGRAAAVSQRMADPSTTSRPTPAAIFLMDRPLLFADGWIAVARLQPYRVDWRSPEGKWTVGAPIVAAGRYEDGDKRAWLEREAKSSGRPIRDLANVFGWPDFLPAFSSLESPILGSPDGSLWIARVVTAGDQGNRYDIVNRSGRLAGVLSLPANETVVGFGPKNVYVAVKDADDIQRLRRHPRP